MNVYPMVMISAVNGFSVAEYLLHSIIATWACFMIDPWMDLCSLVMISAMNRFNVAEQKLNSIIATWNMLYDRTMDGCVLFGHDISSKRV